MWRTILPEGDEPGPLTAPTIAGIVVNNAIVLIGYLYLKRRQDGLPIREAAIEAARLRLDPAPPGPREQRPGAGVLSPGPGLETARREARRTS